MPEISDRIASLPESKRRLLEQLLGQKMATKPCSLNSSAATVSAPAPVAALSRANAFEQTSTLGDVKASYKRFYDAVSSQLDSSVFGPFSFFLNYGYVPDLSPQHAKVECPEHFINQNSVRLVLELIGDCDVAGRRVLDIGCGRGGTVFVIKKFFNPLSVYGIDLSPKAIASCRANHKYENVCFDQGDAEDLSFGAAEFDVVTNVESSHSYPNLGAFYSEVFRVLTPGGYFLYTDLIPSESRVAYLALLEKTGFEMELERDVTSNVLLSCDEVARARVSAYHAGNDPELMNNFLAAPGSQVYEDMRTRRWTYRVYRFRRPLNA